MQRRETGMDCIGWVVIHYKQSILELILTLRSFLLLQQLCMINSSSSPCVWEIGKGLAALGGLNSQHSMSVKLKGHVGLLEV